MSHQKRRSRRTRRRLGERLDEMRSLRGSGMFLLAAIAYQVGFILGLCNSHQQERRRWAMMHGLEWHAFENWVVFDHELEPLLTLLGF